MHLSRLGELLVRWALADGATEHSGTAEKFESPGRKV